MNDNKVRGNSPADRSTIAKDRMQYLEQALDRIENANKRFAQAIRRFNGLPTTDKPGMVAKEEPIPDSFLVDLLSKLDKLHSRIDEYEVLLGQLEDCV